MTKKIAVINDLSGFGRCSLTAAIPVISAMGVQACPLPTAILTAQTGYPSYYIDDYTDKMEIYRSQWQKMGQQFDGIYTGFVASEAQIQQISRFVDTFHSPNTFLLVDPVMGDNGNKYDMFTPKLLMLMRQLAKRADIITPNLTELCLLTETDFSSVHEIPDAKEKLAKIQTLAQQFCAGTSQSVVVTGIHFTDDKGVHQMGNLHVTKDSHSLSAFPYIGGSYSGTGDLFASCLAAGVARGDQISDIIEMAGNFLELALTDATENAVPYVDGVNFEKFLYYLIPKKG